MDTKIKHTPGPWRNDDGQIWATVGGDHVMVCDVAPDGTALTEYDIANAPLITAAPDMAEILEIIAADADAGEILLTSGVRIAIDAALIKAGRKATPEPVRHVTIAGGAR